MQSQIGLGRIFGVEIGLHYSWFIIAFLVTLSLGAQFSAANPAWGTGTIWATAILTGLLFFVAIILHELSHAAVAKARGLPVRSITLFALGGIAQIERESADAKTEFWMGIIGPIASAVIGLVCLAAAWLLGWTLTLTPATPLIAMLVWLGVINIGLAIFNMLPGFPLDGGRVLRSIIWWLTDDLKRSTNYAAFVGMLVALGLIFLGIVRFFAGAGFGGLWLAFIGWFLLDAARASQAQVELMESLRGLRVADVMAKDYPAVGGRENLQTFVNEYLLSTGQRYFIVKEQDRIAGLITPHEVKQVPRNKWPYRTVDEVMRPLNELHTVKPDTPLVSALETMSADHVNQLPVVREGRLAGVISRKHILQMLRMRGELQI
jgi:Zn-dependent protease